MAALKRAQAHQRRGCPEQQQPLLAVKVELEQLIISILDDPSVSRVMSEASFSSPAVKSAIEQSLNGKNPTGTIRLGFKPAVAAPSVNRNLYLNPRLQQKADSQSGHQRNEDVQKVFDILTKRKKRNPVLVGEPAPESMVQEILRMIQGKEIDGIFKNVEVVHLWKDLALDKPQMVAKIKELGTQIGAKIGNLDCGGIILDLGDLKWLVESNQPIGAQRRSLLEPGGAAAVAEMAKLQRFGEGNGRLWLIGTATCETYLRCQVYYPSMENDWDLQAVPIASKMLSRFGSNGILNGSVESLSSMNGFVTKAARPRQLLENFDPTRKQGCCPQCMQDYEQEVAKLLAAKEFEKPLSDANSESTQPALPQWLQNARVHDDQAQKIQELQKKWNDTCLHLHPKFHQSSLISDQFAPMALSMTSLVPFQPKLTLNRCSGETLQRIPNLVASQPGSPVRTDLVLGRPKITETELERTHKECVRDFLGCLPSEPWSKLQDLKSNKLLNALDADSFKKLLKGLTEKVWWQQDAASAVAAAVTRCKLDNGKRRGAGSKGDVWLLFAGPDRVGKKKMASVLSNQVCGADPVVIGLGSRRDDGEPDLSFRGKTVLDRIAEAVKRNPFSVVMLEDIDEANVLVRGGIKRAMERGRLTDSHGREISLGNVIFILTANWLPDNLKFSSKGISLDEKKLTCIASGGWQLRLSVLEKTSKCRACWHMRQAEQQSQGRVTNVEYGSHNSSDLTGNHEEHGLANRLSSNSTSSIFRELLDSVDDAIFFKPVDFGPIRRNMSNNITKRFSSIIGERVLIEIIDDALEKITSGVWIGRIGLEEWIEKTLVPSLQRLKTQLPVSDESLVVRLELDDESRERSHGDWLPGSIKVVLDAFS
ncbi:hypothetical protein GOBAR_AA34311 [Gossypium barbadense]|uniref:Clp R domain-containing protein n=1 Tax=Gossypium barbadense TaxID=3634 RepID=A0A2P5W5P4_GOSBA|nr:hypothetical protein GOBAR_AA34311 [Gossypium barbadense]